MYLHASSQDPTVVGMPSIGQDGPCLTLMAIILRFRLRSEVAAGSQDTGVYMEEKRLMLAAAQRCRPWVLIGGFTGGCEEFPPGAGAANMAVERVSPGQKVLNRYVYTGGVFAALAALTIGHYAWVSPVADQKPGFSVGRPSAITF